MSSDTKLKKDEECESVDSTKYRGMTEEIASRKERVHETYDYRSQYDAYEYDTYHANYNIKMEDDTMYRGEYDDQYFHPSSYETPSFFNQPQRPTQEYYYQGQKQAHDASFVALETHVDRLLEQLNKDETYEPQGITVLDFDDEDEEQNEEFLLHSTNTMEYSTFGSCKDIEDVDDHNNSFEDLISPIKEHDKESVSPINVDDKDLISLNKHHGIFDNRFPLSWEEVMEANTTPYLPTLEEPILSPIDDIRSKEDVEFLALSLYEDKCSNLLEEAEVTHIHLNPPQLPRVVINQVWVDDSVFENKNEQDNVSLVKDAHHVVERCYENSFSKLTHIIVKKVHRKARVGVRNLSQLVCYGKKNFREVSNCDKLIQVASKRSCVKQVRSASSQRKRKRRVWVSKHKHFFGLRENNISKVFKYTNMTWTRKAEIRQGNSYGKCFIKPP
uniref:Uncharacterized protein n=1 Tax=Tanacetum cinerariifolium TaxID=118510 RepID=A0A6L2JIR0_TANCI|nr:hypothetical protein [Tanacetum cinerariifolium]